MKKRFALVLALLLVIAMAVSMTSCSNKQEEPEEEGAMTQEVEEGPVVIKTIDGVDDDESDIPLQISSITLLQDGSVLVVPVDDLRKNEMKDDEDAEGVYPFADSGKVKDIYVMYYGNGGFRTLIALLEDGTISAVNGKALIEDHIFAVMNTVSGRDNFISVENVADESAWSIIGHTDDGEDIVLDYSLNFD